MAKKQKIKIPGDLCYDHPLSWYTDPTNIPNQDLVQQTIQWFETGPGNRAFYPLEFLNLLYKQYRFLLENIEEKSLVQNHFLELPLSNLQKHILCGFLLKWTGGYPIRSAMREHEPTLRVIEEMFLSQDADSPEREFCKADMQQRKQFMQLEIALTAAINGGLDASGLLAQINEKEEETQYNNFKDLFKDAYLMDAVGPFSDYFQYLTNEALHQVGFNTWLFDFKGWCIGDELTYPSLLNRATFMEYLRYDKRQQELNKKKLAEQKALWRLDGSTKLSIDPAPNVVATSKYHSDVYERLEAFREDLFKSNETFDQSVNTIAEFLNTRKAISIKQVFIRSGKNKKLAAALGQIWKDHYNETMPFSYLIMCRDLFSAFSKYSMDEDSYKSSNLYKYFLSAT